MKQHSPEQEISNSTPAHRALEIKLPLAIRRTSAREDEALTNFKNAVRDFSAAFTKSALSKNTPNLLFESYQQSIRDFLEHIEISTNFDVRGISQFVLTTVALIDKFKLNRSTKATARLQLAFDRLKIVGNEYVRLKSQQNPETRSYTLFLTGSNADVEALGARLRAKALELIRAKQAETAKNYGWIERPGEQVRYDGPPGTKLAPIYEMHDLDNEDTIKTIVSNFRAHLTDI